MTYNNDYANSTFWKNFNNGANMFNARQSYASSGSGNNFFNQQKARANSSNLANNNFIRLGSMSYNASQDPYSQSLNQPLNNGNANSLASNQFIANFGNMQRNAINSANARYNDKNMGKLYNVSRTNLINSYQNLQPLASQAMSPRERMYAMGDWAMGTLLDQRDIENQNALNKWNSTMAYNIANQRESAYQNDLKAQQNYNDYVADMNYRNSYLTQQQQEALARQQAEQDKFNYDMSRDSLADAKWQQEREIELAQIEQKRAVEKAKLVQQYMKQGKKYEEALKLVEKL